MHSVSISSYGSSYTRAHHTHTQPFNGPWSGTTRVGRYQKKHSPTHAHSDHWTSFINFLHLLRSIASSLFSLRTWQSSLTTSLQVLWSSCWSWTLYFIFHAFLHPLTPTRCKWRKMIKEARWSGWVWVGECSFWYRPTRVVPDQRPLNGRCCCCSSPNHHLFAAHAHTIAACSAVIPMLSSIPNLSLSSLLGILSFSLMPHIHLTILISARWSATTFSFLTGQVSLLCNMLLHTQLLYNLPLIINDMSLLVSSGTSCLNLYQPIRIMASTAASASPSTHTLRAHQ